MGRSPCCAKEGLNRGAWTAMEDKILTEYIKVHGEGRWRNLPKRAGLKRCGKSCRLRWLNYLRPDIKRGNITPDEEELIIRLHKLLGNRWSLIAGRLPGRTDNEIKNYWNTNLSKRVNQHCKTSSSTTKQQQKKSRIDQQNKKLVADSGPTLTPASSVVRTKAVRCTKVFINPPDPPQPSTDSMYLQPNSIGHDNGECLLEHISLAGVPEEENKIDMDFMGNNLDVGDFSLISEILDSDNFSNIFDFSNETCNGDDTNNNSSNELSPNSPEYHPFVFSQEMLEDWLGDQQL